MSDLFDFPVLRVEQPRKMMPTQVRYEIFNADNALLAVAAETDVRSRRQALLAARPGAVPDVRSLVVSGADGAPLLTIEQQESRRLTLVLRPDGEPVGAIRAERTTRHYTLLGPADHPVGTITGDLSLRHFVISDDQGGRAALIDKKWAGLLAELLTTADRYSVEISDPVPEPLRTLVVVSAVVLDLTLHEFRDLV